MKGASSRHEQNLIELFGEESVSAALAENYVDINETALLIKFESFSWPAFGHQALNSWMMADCEPTFLNPTVDQLSAHDHALDFLLQGLSNQGRRLLTRIRQSDPDDPTILRPPVAVDEFRFQWIDPSELFCERGYFPGESLKRVFVAGQTFDLVLVKSRDLQPFQTLLLDNNNASRVPAEENSDGLAATKTGRPRTWDWDTIFSEIVLIANGIDGLPENQAQLVSQVMDRCMELYGNYPSESQLKKKTKYIYDRLGRKAQNSDS